MDIVDRFLKYRESGDVELLIASDINIERQNLNVIVIQILAWLKLEHKRSLWIAEGKKTNLKPYKMELQFSWCTDLKQLVEKEKIFQNYFKIKNGGLYLSDLITEQEKEMIRKKAYENYNPPEHIYRRKRIVEDINSHKCTD